MPERLLAKSVEGTDLYQHATLQQHLTDVFDSAIGIISASGHDQLSAFGLAPSQWQDRFRQTVLLAAAIHDLGKANNQFQQMIGGNPQQQAVRHEWISVWLAEQPAVKAWLLPAVDGCQRCWHVAMAAVAGHHPKHGRCSPKMDEFNSEPIEVFVEHRDFHACLLQIQAQFGLNKPPSQIPSILFGGVKDHKSPVQFCAMVERLTDFFINEINSDPTWRRFCACAKACLVASDVAGSALWEHIDTAPQRQSWIAETLNRRPAPGEIDSIVTNRLGSHSPREFQKAIADSDASITLVEAGCGSGKTVAAYMWANQQQTGRRLWFCYPTTGTATAGFQSYLLEAETNDPSKQSVIDGADLFHSRQQYDKLQILGTRELDDNVDDASVRVESLKAWDTKIVACTVDSLLLILQNQRRGLYSWPAISQSAIVFDEVHSYDDVLFGNLLTFLRELPGIPVLLMTASLPISRREAIEKAAKKAKRSFRCVPGPRDLEQLPRYFRHESDVSFTREDAIELVRDEFDSGGRVLWISNTVERTRKLGIELADCNASVYHSRFIYKDRVDRHNEVTAMFDSHDGGCATTSQVAEMSLDLKHATLLVTELAPIPALIQRLGRLNRAIHPGQPEEERPPRPFVVIKPVRDDGEFSSAPYDEIDLELARAWLSRLGEEPISQSQLVDAWRAIDTTSKVKAEISGWLTGGMETLVDSIRAAGYGVTVIRENDLPDVKRNRSVVAYTLPMNYPVSDNWRLNNFRQGGFPVASETAIDYCPKTGAVWSTFVIF
ncbi:putative CRISPR-associated nuclease/helicase Cas3 [Novipirellula galeiformis]|uniref:Putative CRISPR-associated nuclease/helicase Cas3 n=1 Tax=Novipirellula galeiformis TaxID=2528004 RepID=A0A5C6CU04_9BACT|nr:CRISPR-associated helicase Cas3' [Novipirellula galeiformis]TWU26516.1 putative CRISPR-associated nuclease/helicase Cas3 [Novipirellula galeiformis]